MRRQRHDLWGTDSKEWLGVDDECADPSFRQCRKGIVKLALTAGAPEKIFEIAATLQKEV